MEYFIIGEGYMWDSILDVLKEKAANGVEVRLIYDDLGCVNTLPPQYYRHCSLMESVVRHSISSARC